MLLFLEPMDILIDTVFSFNMETMTWTTLPSLLLGRFGHSCGVVSTGPNQKLVIVAGGFDGYNFAISTVEMLLVAEEEGSELFFDNQWHTGPDMPFPLGSMASSTIKLGQQQSLVTIGGIMSNNEASSHILKLECPDLMCEWTMMDFELSAPSAFGLALHFA